MRWRDCFLACYMACAPRTFSATRLARFFLLLWWCSAATSPHAALRALIPCVPYATSDREDHIMEPLIRLRNLEKSYDLAGGKYFVLRRISLDIEPGEFVTVLGPSGGRTHT